MATPIDTKKPDLPTLHHMNNSQSQRVLWLLEELGIEYNLILHTRTSGHRAPAELKSIHELGKAPIFCTSSGRPIVETSAIMTYILRTYDSSQKFTSTDWIRDEELTSFASATLGPLTAIELLFDIASKNTPWPFVYLARAVQNGIRKNYSQKEFELDLGYLERELGDKEWFTGNGEGGPGRADFMLSWPFDIMAQRGWVDFGLEGKYKGLGAWRRRIEGREAWKRGLEKGNGYVLSTW